MSVLTEEILRKAASWQAFKEGRSLFENGLVMDAAAGSTGWKGSVKSGSRAIRVGVTMRSATDIEARCACPENRSTGAVCAHAVATGLAVISGKSAATKQEVAPPKEDSPVARKVVFAGNWRDAFARGRLTATVTRDGSRDPSRADRALAAWLTSKGAADRSPAHLNLAGADASEFLGCLIAHPDVSASGNPLEIADGGRIPLRDEAPENGKICLRPGDGAGEWAEIGASIWRAEEARLVRAGARPVPEPLAEVLAALRRTGEVRMSVANLLRQLDSWQDWLSFPPDGWLENLRFTAETPEFQLALDGDLAAVTVTARVAYPGSAPVPPGIGDVPNLPRWEADRCFVRNSGAEESLVRQLEAAGFSPSDLASGTWRLSGESAVIRLLAHDLPGWRERWSITTSARFEKSCGAVALVEPRIEILGSGEDWLGFDLRFQTSDGMAVPAADVRQWLRSGSRPGSAKGRRWVVPDEVSDVLEPLLSELEIHQENGRFEASKRSAEVIREIGKKWSKSHDKGSSQVVHKLPEPAGLRAELRPYQQQGFAWLCDRLDRFGGALLADDMGLGKTLQTIACIERLFDGGDGVVLVIATASLLGNWQAEFGRFAPARTVRVLHGTGRDEERGRVAPGEVVLTSFGTLARDLAWHLRQDYLAAVVDEASLMRNPDTDHAKAICKLNARNRIALTGTPLENGVRDLWSIFRFVQPGWLGRREEFRDRYEVPLKESGAGAVLERLRLRTSPFLLRRTKEQVAPELPAKIFIDEFCELTPDQQGVYRAFLEEGRRQVDALHDAGQSGAARMRVLTALLRLRQTCCDLALLKNDRFNRLLVSKRSGKLQRLLELLEEAVDGGHRVLVFSQFQSQLLEIEKCVSERGWDSLRLDGQTRDRQQLVNKFQEPGGPPVFLISLKAGGYGLNLTAADTVIHFDPWWNPAAEAQATDRAHRIGQTRPVTVYRLLTRGTVEEKVVALQRKKRELASAIDEAGMGDAPGWSIDELGSLMD
ncbi:MAG: DEAD/DEAH box helicase [Akkermansiaceae bacterium]|nr:DEAD/DEAH box helicase [Akkermansiaceae bacterium]